ERNRRGGTENVPGIVGFGAAAEQAAEELSQAVEIEALRDQLEAAIKSIAPGTVIHGENVDRLPNTTCLSMPNVVSETQVMKFDLAGFMISAGAACSSGKVQASHVLLAMGVEDEEASTAIRISLGHTNNASDVEAFVEQWREMYARANRDALKGAA
ncbi:MAG: aminotransferase class V-fold PLP-dependent enzyme, partial [Rhodospirillaceae bacterium]|nr:aminotransferase class V-fold PLP-dependent enzyme [Rhodospirillaceae bacterium]